MMRRILGIFIKSARLLFLGFVASLVTYFIGSGIWVWSAKEELRRKHKALAKLESTLYEARAAKEYSVQFREEVERLNLELRKMGAVFRREKPWDDSEDLRSFFDERGLAVHRFERLVDVGSNGSIAEVLIDATAPEGFAQLVALSGAVPAGPGFFEIRRLEWEPRSDAESSDALRVRWVVDLDPIRTEIDR